MSADAQRAGLCATCVNVRLIAGARSTFVLCELSRSDPRFPRYPRLPVLECAGYEPRPQEAGRPPLA